MPSADAALRTAAPISQTEPGVLSTLTIPAAQSVTKKAATVPQGWSVTATGTMAQAMEAEEATGSGRPASAAASPVRTCGSWARDSRTVPGRSSSI